MTVNFLKATQEALAQLSLHIFSLMVLLWSPVKQLLRHEKGPLSRQHIFTRLIICSSEFRNTEKQVRERISGMKTNAELLV